MNSPSPSNASTPVPLSKRSGRPSRRRLVSTALVAIIVVALDVTSKEWVLRTIGPADRKRIIGTLSLVRRFNTGAAFSFGNGKRATAWAVTVVVCVVVVGVTRHLVNPPENSPVGSDRRWWWVLGLIVGGAIGNQLDRLFRNGGWNRGAVVDFIDVGFFPIFNVADSALTVGCIAAAALSLLAPPLAERPLSTAPTAPFSVDGTGTAGTQVPVTEPVTHSEESAR